MEMQRQVYDGTEWVPVGEPVEVPTMDIPMGDGGFLRVPIAAVESVVATAVD